MNSYEITRGTGRTKVGLSAHHMGDDLVIRVYNQNAHIGAVAVSEYDDRTRRTSTSVITRLGHKDDVVAQKAAYLVCKATKKPVCLIVGVHLENVTQEEIAELLQNTDRLVNEFISRGCEA
jgi:hypothetical protein